LENAGLRCKEGQRERLSITENNISFEVGPHKPNAGTIAAIEELEAMRRGDVPERTMSVEEMRKKRL
jgi:hypothetical protein